MKKTILLYLLASTVCLTMHAQTNSLDNYIGNALTLTTIAGSAQQVSQPRDLDFKPNTNELWVCNYGSANGGTMVIVYNAGLANQSSQYRKDSHSDHFMPYPSALAFGDDGKWANVNEIQNTNSASPTFMGPALWLGDTSIFARVFQNNWLTNYPLGSHIDMLHQSPFAMGIAHDSAMAYWVMDGYNGNICKYDYVMDHGPGYDNHSAGKIWRYIDVPVTRVAGVPSHMVLDKATGWLYYIDGGSKKIKRLDTNSGSITGTLTVPSTANEPLAGYWKVEGATVEVLDSLSTQPCGIDYYNGRLIVSDYTTGDIYLYNTSGTFALLDTLVTGHPGMMGVKVGPDGRIWCVNRTDNTVYQLRSSVLPAADVALRRIDAPSVENFQPAYFSAGFNECTGTISPAVTLANTGTDTVTSVDLYYTVDGAGSTPYSWSGMLAPGDTASVLLPASAVANGSHLLSVTIATVNGAADDVDLNNTLHGSFRVLAPAATIPFTEDFASATFPPSGWNYVHFNPNNKMTRVAIGGFGLSTGCLKMNNYSGPMNITGQQDYLMSPLLNMNSATAATWLRFSVAYAKRNTSSADRLQVSASTDCGNTWSVIYSKSGTALATAPVAAGTFSPTATQWRTDSVSLAAFAGQAEVELMFTAISNYGNNLYIDDIFAGDLVTGIPEPASGISPSLYPNPVTDGMLTIHFPGANRANPEIRIFNPLGQEIMPVYDGIENQEMKINTTSLPPGTYFVKINAGGKVYDARFVKM